MNIIYEEKRNITVKEAARMMKKHEMFVRIGLQKRNFEIWGSRKITWK